MVKAYIPIDKKEGKANIRGLWKSKEQGACYDYLKRINLEPCNLIYVKKHYKQEAIFYREIDKGSEAKAFIWYNSKKQEVLKNQHYFGFDGQRGIRGLKVFIKGLLRTFGGFTVYIRGQNYLFEVWN